LQKSSGIINDGTGKSQTRIQLSNNISRLEREGQLPTKNFYHGTAWEGLD